MFSEFLYNNGGIKCIFYTLFDIKKIFFKRPPIASQRVFQKGIYYEGIQCLKKIVIYHHEL